MKYFLCLFLFVGASRSFASPSRHCLYLMQQHPKKAIGLYRNQQKKLPYYDLQLLREMSLVLLEKAAESEEKQMRMLAIYGAGLSASSLSFAVLEKSLSYQDPELQLMGLFFIAQLQDARSRQALQKAATSSPFLAVRAEACYHMVLRKEPRAISYVQSLMSCLPPFFRAFFPQFFAMYSTRQASAFLKQLLQDSNPYVRVQSILSIVQAKRDDFLPAIRLKATQGDLAEIEAAVYALGIFNDANSVHTLRKLSSSSPMNIRIAALRSLYLLGEETVVKDLELLALSHDLFAIAALGDIPGGEDTLYELTKTKKLQVRLNAAASLLKRKDPRCTKELANLFLQAEKALGIRMQSSIGGSQKILRTFSLAPETTDEGKRQRSVSRIMKENLLKSALYLPEKDFFPLAENLFTANERTFVPCLMHLLKNIRTEKAIALLKKLTKKVGAPFIRNYANLILFSIEEEGPYEKRVRNFLEQVELEETMHLQTHLSLSERKDLKGYHLSPAETSHLFLDVVTELVARQDKESIDLVLSVMERSSEKLQIALAGALIKATE